MIAEKSFVKESNEMTVASVNENKVSAMKITMPRTETTKNGPSHRKALDKWPG